MEDYDEDDGYDMFPDKFEPNFSEYYESEYVPLRLSLRSYRWTRETALLVFNLLVPLKF